MQSLSGLSFGTVWHDRVSSTNDVCMDIARAGAPEGAVVAARYQEQGRGQRGNSWESGQGLNLTFSVLLRPRFLRVDEQFLISKVAALSVCDWVNTCLSGRQAAIKWPNDTYIGNRKVAGILIENSFSSAMLDVSVVGIGINLNQREFPSGLPNPTSLAIETGSDFGLESSLSELLDCLGKRYAQAKGGAASLIGSDYLSRLYRRGAYCTYRAGGEEFRAMIVGVRPSGELMLRTEAGEEQLFAFQEVSFVI